MTMLDERDLAALALTSRLVESAAKPLSAREFWQLTGHIDPAALRGRSVADIAAEGVPGEDAERLARLFDRATGLALAIERLDHSGIWTITGVGQHYPERLRARLGHAAPVVLHGVGDAAVLNTDGAGVVGSRNTSDEGAHIAGAIAHLAVRAGLPVVSGAARGVDRAAMNAACQMGGHVVGVLADSLERTVTRPAMRRGVAGGQICLITPYTPDAPFSVGNAMGRNRIIYGLARCTIAVTADQSGGTWQGATEALKHGYGSVVSWTGPGSGAGNGALVKLGAIELTDVDRLGNLLDESVVPAPINDAGSSDQLTLDLSS